MWQVIYYKAKTILTTKWGQVLQSEVIIAKQGSTGEE